MSSDSKSGMRELTESELASVGGAGIASELIKRLDNKKLKKLLRKIRKLQK